MSVHQIGQDLRFELVYKQNTLRKTGLTVTGDVYRDGVLLAAGVQCIEVGTSGSYAYTLPGASVTLPGLYKLFGHTDDLTVDAQDVEAAWLVGMGWVENLDAAISTRADAAVLATALGDLLTDIQTAINTRLAAADYVVPPTDAAIAAAVWAHAARSLTEFAFNVVVATNLDKGGYSLTVPPPTANAIRDAVWNALTTEFGLAGSMGQAMTAAGQSGDPLLALVPGSYAVGTAGWTLGLIAAGRGIIQVPVASNGDIKIYQGDDYRTPEIHRICRWIDAHNSWSDLPGAMVTLTLRRRATGSRTTVPDITVPGVIEVATGPNKAVVVELPASITSTLAVGDRAYSYKLRAVLFNGHQETLAEGDADVE
jgi:hypothetical protein